MSKRSLPTDKKLEALTAYKEGIYLISEICSLYNIHESTFAKWRYNYEKYGVEGLKESNGWKKYSRELKLAAVLDYQSGQYSLMEVVRKYEISSDSVLIKWINKYNGHKEIKATGRGSKPSMTKGRSTSWQERIDIVLYCLSKNKDYQQTAETYGVSYQQVYQWVKKYEDGGEDALKDRRGRNKTEEELSPEEKVKLEMKKLERENERLRAENAFLKKLKEIERRRS